MKESIKRIIYSIFRIKQFPIDSTCISLKTAILDYLLVMVFFMAILLISSYFYFHANKGITASIPEAYQSQFSSGTGNPFKLKGLFLLSWSVYVLIISSLRYGVLYFSSDIRNKYLDILYLSIYSTISFAFYAVLVGTINDFFPMSIYNRQEASLLFQLYLGFILICIGWIREGLVCAYFIKTIFSIDLRKALLVWFFGSLLFFNISLLLYLLVF